MPYKSEVQRKFMHAKYPEIAVRWDAEMKGTKMHKSKVKSAAQKHFGGKY